MKKNILYLGKDLNFLKDLQIFILSSYSEFSVINENNLIMGVDEVSPQLIILDDLPGLLQLSQELRLIKSCSRFRSTAIVALCYDKDEVAAFAHLISLGVQIFFIKGGDQESFLKDCSKRVPF